MENLSHLAKKHDDELEKFVEEKILESKNKPSYYDVTNKSVDEVAEELKSHPAFMTEFDESKPLSQAMEALQIMKYESQSNDENAISYKEDGNKNFERKKYRWAIDNYTAGLNCKPTDTTLLCVLYCNRAASQFRIKNYRSSLNDCIMALKFIPNHKKALLKAIENCLNLEKYNEAKDWCDKTLLFFENDEKVINWRLQADKKLKILEKEERRKMLLGKKNRKELLQVISDIKNRGFSLDQQCANLTFEEEEWIKLVSEEHNGSKIIINNETKSLCWPIMFLYPEFSQSDFIMSFDENSRFIFHLHNMFGEKSESHPSWDVSLAYKPETIQIYIESSISSKSQLYQIESSMTLLETLQKYKSRLNSSLAVFVLLVKESNYENVYLTDFSKGYS